MNEFDRLQATAKELAGGEAPLQEEAQSSKYEGMAVSDRFFCACLFEIAAHGFPDAEISDEFDGTWAALIERWIITQDAQGFRDITEFKTQTLASAKWQELENEVPA